MLIDYPSDFPQEAMTLVLDMLKGTFHDVRYDVQVADTVLMYALGRTLPVTPAPAPVAKAEAREKAKCCKDDAVKQIELALAAHNGNFHAGLGSLNWLAIAQAAAALLQQFLSQLS